MIEVNVPQLSDEWFQARVGIPSASCFSKIVTSRGDLSKQSKACAYTLAGERMLGEKMEGYQNGAMQRGIELEDEARQLFGLITGLDVRKTGLIYPDENKRYSCSPDGLVCIKQTGLEIKCPLIHTHIDYFLKSKLPTEYILQVQGSLLVTGFDHWYFMSYFPGLPPLILKIERDEGLILKLSNALDDFCILIDKTVEKLKEVA